MGVKATVRHWKHIFSLCSLVLVLACNVPPPDPSHSTYNSNLKGTKGETTIPQETNETNSDLIERHDSLQANWPIHDLPRAGLIYNVTDTGGIVVGLWETDEPTSRLGRGVYLFDTVTKRISLLATPTEPKNKINKIRLEKNWLVWLESTAGSIEAEDWKLYAKDLSNNQQFLVTKGNLKTSDLTRTVRFEPSGLSLSMGQVVWNEFQKDSDGNFKTAIVLYNLATGRKEIITTEPGAPDTVVETPVISGRMIVWGKATFLRSPPSARTNVMVYSQESREIKNLTQNGASFSPVVFGNTAVWMYRDTSRNSFGDIELFDLEANNFQRITSAHPGEGLYQPTLSARLVGWQTTKGLRAEVFDRLRKEILTVDRGLIDIVRVGGNVVAWRWMNPEAVAAFERGEVKHHPRWSVRYAVAN